MTFKTTLLAGTVLGVAAIASGAAVAQTAPAAATSQAQLDTLNRQIQTLQGQLKSLEEKLNKDIKAVDKKIVDAPTVTVDNGRPRFRSANRDFDIALRARFHVDYGVWMPDAGFSTNGVSANTDIGDGFNIRRARLGVAGTVFGNFAFTFATDFSGNRGNAARLQEASIFYTGFKNWSIDVGFFQPSFTLEDTISSNDIPFIERASAVNVATSQVAAEGRGAIGFRHWGTNYRVSAYLTGQQLSESGANLPNDDQASFIGRASFRPYTSTDGDLHLGTSFGYLWEPNAAPGANGARAVQLRERPENRIGGGTRFVDAGAINADAFAVYGGEFAFTHQSFWTYGEYYKYIDQLTAGRPDLEFEGYYISAGYLLTGDRRTYSVQNGNLSAPRVQWPFKTSGGFGTGAWELAARYSYLDLTDPSLTATTQGEQTIMTFGINWYPNAAIRFMLNYQIIEVDRLNSIVPVANRNDLEADALVARMQLQF
jgi:phosphate-selective porin OprO and OprP